jgi:hypothetical protein
VAEAAVAVAAVVVADSDVFDVIDVLGGATILVKPNATLDGSLPVRAVRACSPLLDGNRFGFQVKLTLPLTFTKTLTGVKLAGMPDALTRAVSGSMPRVLAEGLLDSSGRWALSFADGIVVREKGNRRQISLFTGIFVKPRQGHWLRLGDAGNRRNIAFTVEERWIADPDVFTPVILTLTFGPDTPFPLNLSGEIATLAPFASDLPWKTLEGDDPSKLGQAHFAFFDDKYFAQKKKGTSTKKYRKLVDTDPAATLKNRDFAGHATLGPRSVGPTAVRTFLTPGGITLGTGNDLGTAVFHNIVPLVCSFDGHLMHVELDKVALNGFAQTTRDAWTQLFGADDLEQRKGAMWYFTKYVTPHQPGEPYFFVKPPALMTTPAGYSTLIEGLPGQGYSILRGVVATDVFHALPAVFRIDRPLHRIEIPVGTPLARFIPFPRRLMDATFRVVDWAHAPRLREHS